MKATTVADVMTRDVVSVRPDTHYKVLVRLMLDHDISAVPVLDEHFRVAGVVSEADLLVRQAEHDDPPPEHWELLLRRGRAARSKAHGATAAELMTGPAVTVHRGCPVSSAARIMRRHGVKRLPVVDDDGVLIGIVSRGDLLTPYLRSDNDVKQAVVREVLADALCVDPLTVHVEVDDGVVTLTGQLENEFTTHDAVRMTRALDGVVDVVDRLTFRHPLEIRVPHPADSHRAAP